jgi:signal transduction histidine kinase
MIRVSDWAIARPRLPRVALPIHWPLVLPIRWRLALLYALVLGLCVLATDVLVYIAVDRYLAQEIDDSLASQAQEIAGTTRVAVVGGPFFVSQVQIALPNLTVFSSPGVSVQALRESGQIVQRSANLGDRELPVSPDALERVQEGARVYETVFLDGTPVRLHYAPLRIGGEVVGVLQVARSLGEADLVLARLRFAFVGIGALSLIVATLGGWWLARAALRPIDRLTRDARAIGESRDFGRRVTDLTTRNDLIPGDEVGRLATTFDEMLSQLQAAYDELEQTLAAQRRFVADASHELRTPLTTVRTNLELLHRASDSLDPTDREEALADALAEIERLSRLVANLLTLARVDSGLRLERRQPVNVDRVVREVYRQARFLALPREQRLVLDAQERLEVVGDPDYLKELLLILVDNAISYTPDGGEIRLTAEQVDGEVHVAVADNGVGIDPTDIPHLFERFYRADRTRAREAHSQDGGTGLGLSIARWIVDEHGGKIQVRSQVGGGSTFTVRLPALSQPASPVLAAARA